MVLGSRAAMGYVMGRGAGAAAADWWLSGGVSAANCVVAYQPKGAASLAASYTNLANPGTYTAAPGVAPTFAAATGWTFAAESTTYLNTGIVPASGWSFIIRFNGTADGGVPIGTYKPNARFFVQLGSTVVVYASGSLVVVSPQATSGVLAIAGQQGYRNGTADGAAISAWTDTTTLSIYIGAHSRSDTGIGSYYTGSIQAIAIYNATLSAAQVSGISAAMAAL